ncbi:MAG: cyclic nucleotide-binding domain-containing protein [Pseudomonadales bacterium]|nr:cyclic nucleotide-binding domain-containing protein [Pseudomonadales bacterium]
MESQQPDPEFLKRFAPFNSMGDQSLRELASKAQLVSQPGGNMLFKRNEERRWCHWLVRGKVDLVNSNFEAIPLSPESEESRKMLDDHPRYQLTAIAVEDSVFLEIDKDTLDLALTVDQSKGQSQDDDWMTNLLESRLFELIPPANIQALFNKFSPVKFNEGDVVIKQGDEGDYFYVVSKGRLSIDRDIKGETKHLAEVGPGAFFGEDALVSDAPRNATITMLTAGVLMRLGKDDFRQLLQEPASEYVTMHEVRNVMASGEQKIRLLDVRHPKEFQQGSIKGAINVPLPVLRQNLPKLKNDAAYVVITTGRRGELAAFLLNEAGLDAYVLKEEQPEATATEA